MTKHIAYPFQVDGKGRTATTTEELHIKEMVEQLLFTSPGERVNRPEFGTGVMQMVFAPNSQELATATEFMIQSALQQYLGDIIKPEEVTTTSRDATLTITVRYIVLKTQQRQTAQFSREI